MMKGIMVQQKFNSYKILIGMHLIMHHLHYNYEKTAPNLLESVHITACIIYNVLHIQVGSLQSKSVKPIYASYIIMQHMYACIAALINL